MRPLERTLVLVALAGFLMKVMLIPGGSEVLLIGCTLAAMFYWLVSIAAFNQVPLGGLFKKASYTNIGAGRIAGAIVMGISLSTIIIGIQFRLLLLTGATEMITIGALSLIAMLLVSLVVMFLKNKTSDAFYRGVFLRGGLAVVIGIVVLLVPATNWISLYHRDDPQYRDLFIKAHENPRDQEAQQEFENYRLKAESTK